MTLPYVPSETQVPYTPEHDAAQRITRLEDELPDLCAFIRTLPPYLVAEFVSRLSTIGETLVGECQDMSGQIESWVRMTQRRLQL